MEGARMNRKDGVIDWRKRRLRIHGDPLSPDWLETRRQELETVIEPFLTTKKTNHIVEFRGKRRYLAIDPRHPEWVGRPGWAVLEHPHYAVLALQFLYRMESARSAGDIEKAIQMAIAFARTDAEVQNLHWFQTPSPHAMIRDTRRRIGSAEGGKKSSKWTADLDRLARTIFMDVKRSNVSDDAAYRRTAAKLLNDHDISISPKTLRRHLNLGGSRQH
jgi:hypothetical protein